MKYYRLLNKSDSLKTLERKRIYPENYTPNPCGLAIVGDYVSLEPQDWEEVLEKDYLLQKSDEKILHSVAESFVEAQLKDSDLKTYINKEEESLPYGGYYHNQPKSRSALLAKMGKSKYYPQDLKAVDFEDGSGYIEDQDSEVVIGWNNTEDMMQVLTLVEDRLNGKKSYQWTF